MNVNKIKRFFYLQKEGIIVGSLIGAFLAWRGWNLPLNLPDAVSSGIPKIIIMIIIFGVVGCIIDMLYAPNK